MAGTISVVGARAGCALHMWGGKRRERMVVGMEEMGKRWGGCAGLENILAQMFWFHKSEMEIGYEAVSSG